MTKAHDSDGIQWPALDVFERLAAELEATRNADEFSMWWDERHGDACAAQRAVVNEAER